MLKAYKKNKYSRKEGDMQEVGLSPVDKLKKKTPNYYMQVLLDVDAGRVRSPLTGENSKLKHHRCWVVLDRKECFDKVPEVHNEEPDREFASILDPEDLADGYLCMPDTDQRFLDFSTAHQSKEGASYVATIHAPTEVGRGHHNFVSEVVSPSQGRCPPWTATGASVWVLRAVNKRATITRMRNCEGATAYCTLSGTHRNFPAELLKDTSYLGQSALGNAVPINVMDAFYVATLHDLSLIQEDGTTPHERWLSAHSLLPESHPSPASGGRGKRKEREITYELDTAILRVIGQVQDNAKRPRCRRRFKPIRRTWGSGSMWRNRRGGLAFSIKSHLMKARGECCIGSATN